jgi:hypothetical protein
VREDLPRKVVGPGAWGEDLRLHGRTYRCVHVISIVVDVGLVARLGLEEAT